MKKQKNPGDMYNAYKKKMKMKSHKKGRKKKKLSDSVKGAIKNVGKGAKLLGDMGMAFGRNLTGNDSFTKSIRQHGASGKWKRKKK